MIATLYRRDGSTYDRQSFDPNNMPPTLWFKSGGGGIVDAFSVSEDNGTEVRRGPLVPSVLADVGVTPGLRATVLAGA